MNTVIIDKISEVNATCFLIKAKLADYINAVPDDYRTYEVQREIVKNTYLDNLIITILDKKHIPQMVLVSNETLSGETGELIRTTHFKILDGLQRTYRLKSIFETVNFLKTKLIESDEILGLKKIQLSRTYKDELEKINSSSALLYRLLEYYKNQPVRSLASLDVLFDRWQWFELWIGLTDRDEINKMLTLNAGHKPVKTQHQLELLFNNMISIFRSAQSNKFNLVRERDVPSISYSKSRELGQFHFSHLITAILSFHEGIPLTNNVQLIQKAQANDFDDTIFDSLISYDFLFKFIECVLAIDVTLNTKYKDIGVRWIGRETSLVGLFAACGKFAKEKDFSAPESLDVLKNKIQNQPEYLQLDKFEEQRNRLDLAKVNIGSVNKRAVFKAVYDWLSGDMEAISWSVYFNSEK
jgi:hypothetical protein